MAKKKRRDDVALIFAAIQDAKAKTIKRINRQLTKMAPSDLQTLERLLGKR